MKKCGIDIGGSFIKYTYFDEDYQWLNTIEKPFPDCSEVDEFFDYLFDGIDLEDVETVGVCCLGVIDAHSTITCLNTAHCHFLEGCNIHDEVLKRTGRCVTAVNDAKAAAICESRLGALKDCEIGVAYIVGTGVGGAIVHRGEIIYGVDGFAGEFSYQANAGAGSYVEGGNLASISYFLQRYQYYSGIKTSDAKEVFEKIDHDSFAVLAFEDWLKGIVAQLLTITAFINPDRISLGGSWSDSEWLVERVVARYQEECCRFLGNNKMKTQVVSNAYRKHANALGAVLKSEE